MEFVLFVAGTAVVVVVGFGIGMLLAPRIARWAQRDEEDPRDHPRG